MGLEWYYQQNGQKHGPISGASLKQLAAAGKLQPTDHVWKEGMTKWLPARSVKGLFPAAPAPVATVAPPPPPVKAVSHVADGAGEVVEVIPAPAKPSLQERALGLFGKVKRLWQPLGTPAKAGIVGGVVGGVFLLLLLFCVLPLWWFFGSGGGAGAVPVKELLQSFLNDRQAAEKKYLGQTVTVRGVISDITNEAAAPPTNDDGNVVKLETGSVPGEVTCTFSLKHAKRLMELGKGKEIVLRGKCTKYNTGKWRYAGKETEAGFLELEDCELLEKGSEPAPGGAKGSENQPASPSNMKPAEFAERLRKITGGPKSSPLPYDGNQAASLFDRPDPYSPKWNKYGTFTLYSVASGRDFRAGDAFQAVGRPDRVSPVLGKDWQEWVWFRNGVGFRCKVTNLTAQQEGREEVAPRDDDRVIVTAPGLLVGGGMDF
jgi:hypothetical protein